MEFSVGEVGLSLLSEFFIFILLQMLGVATFYYYFKRQIIKDGGDIKYLKFLCIIILALFFYITVDATGKNMLLYIDNKLNSVENTTITPIDISGGNDGTYLYDEEGVKYRVFTLAKSDKDELREYYINHECKITYYKLSKVLTDIEVLDP